MWQSRTTSLVDGARVPGAASGCDGSVVTSPTDMPVLLDLVDAVRGQALADQIRAEHEQDEDEGGRPGELDLVLERHAGEVVDQHGERGGRLHQVGVPARPQPVV